MKGVDAVHVSPKNTDGYIEKILHEYSDMVYRIALTNTKQKFDADDIFQEVFLTLFKSNLHFESEEHIKYWLIRVTVNFCKKHHRSAWQKKTVSLDSAMQLSAPMTEQEFAVYDAVCKLPVKYRTVIQLFYFEDMTVEEISRILHRKNTTVKSQLTRARSKLREMLKGDYFYEP